MSDTKTKKEVPKLSREERMQKCVTHIEKCIVAFELTRKAGAMTPEEEVVQRTQLAYMLCALERFAVPTLNKVGGPWLKAMGLLDRVGWRETYGRTLESIEEGFRGTAA